MNIKYSTDQEKELINGYTELTDQDSRELFIEQFRAKHKKSKASVIAKLSKLKDEGGHPLYIARPKISKITGGEPTTKKQILQSIANNLGCDISKLDGIDKSPKLSLLNLKDLIATR